jgi:hypothetical protein
MPVGAVCEQTCKWQGIIHIRKFVSQRMTTKSSAMLHVMLGELPVWLQNMFYIMYMIGRF